MKKNPNTGNKRGVCIQKRIEKKIKPNLKIAKDNVMDCTVTVPLRLIAKGLKYRWYTMGLCFQF